MYKSKGNYLKLKRIIDIMFSLLGIVLLSPFLFLIAIIIKLTSKGPIIFKQVRMGLNGKPFNILKFRTMIVDAEKVGKQITVNDDPRITKIGRLLRKLKLDELPQLYNVLIGDMSLVGPRPEVQKYVGMYSQDQLRVLSVRPGITDYASIEFRNENDLLVVSNNPEETYINKIMPEKLQLNLKYINDISFATDIKLILLTLQKVFIDKGTSSKGNHSLTIDRKDSTGIGL